MTLTDGTYQIFSPIVNSNSGNQIRLALYQGNYLDANDSSNVRMLPHRLLAIDLTMAHQVTFQVTNISDNKYTVQAVGIGGATWVAPSDNIQVGSPPNSALFDASRLIDRRP